MAFFESSVSVTNRILKSKMPIVKTTKNYSFLSFIAFRSNKTKNIKRQDNINEKASEILYKHNTQTEL